MQSTFLGEIRPKIIVGRPVEVLPDAFILDFFTNVIAQFFKVEGAYLIEDLDGQPGVVIRLARRGIRLRSVHGFAVCHQPRAKGLVETV